MIDSTLLSTLSSPNTAERAGLQNTASFLELPNFNDRSALLHDSGIMPPMKYWEIDRSEAHRNEIALSAPGFEGATNLCVGAKKY